MSVKQKNQLLGISIDKQEVFGLISDGKDTFVRSQLNPLLLYTMHFK